jgi:hypothetical protein
LVTLRRRAKTSTTSLNLLVDKFPARIPKYLIFNRKIYKDDEYYDDYEEEAKTDSQEDERMNRTDYRMNKKEIEILKIQYEYHLLKAGSIKQKLQENGVEVK